MFGNVHRPRLAPPGNKLFTLLPLTLLLLFIPFGLTQAASKPESPLYRFYELGGLSWEGLIDQGKIWQLFTHPLLHGGWLHLAGNLFAIFYFGSRLHHLFGEREVLKVTIGGILIGGLAHLLLQGEGLLVGASGIGMGLFVSPESRMAPIPLRARNLRDGVILSSILLLLINPALELPFLSALGTLISEAGFESLFKIGHACHLGGALAAWFCMRKYLRRPITLAQLQQQRSRLDDNEAA